MIKPPLLSSTSGPADLSAVVSFMDTMAVQLVESADTLRASSMTTVAGNNIAIAAEGMVSRAGQIRVLAEGMRTSGDLTSFDEACALAGWQPSPQVLQSLQMVH